MGRTAACIALGVILSAGWAFGEDAYYDIPLRELTIAEGKIPEKAGSWWHLSLEEEPYVVVGNGGEGYVRLHSIARWTEQLYDEASLAVRSPTGADVNGSLYLYDPDVGLMAKISFSIPATPPTVGAKDFFLVAKERHYERLLRHGIAGAAWFRHQARQARKGRTTIAAGEGGSQRAARPSRPGELEDTYAIFTGGRAMSENLQLDRLLQPVDAGQAVVPLDSLPGITVEEMDWTPLVKGLAPEKDPLAAYVPADQHAVFFPSFKAFIAVLDEAKAHGTPVLRLLDSRSEDALTHERYQRQLCLSTDALSRLIGPTVVRSVALTGSDPYLRTGSDVALLFEAKDAAVLSQLISAKISAVAQALPEAKVVRGTALGVNYEGFSSPGRAVSSYRATLGSSVIVTNSLHQLERIVATWKGDIPALASLEEYVFFRARYARGDGEESAFLMVPDGAIRRWCGPRWRIAASRRTRAAAFMAKIQAQHLKEIVSGQAVPGPIDVRTPLPDGGEVALGRAGASDTVYGNLEFLTPIAELPLDKVTQAEAHAYRRWRDRYHRNWRYYFDPIAVRFSVRPARLAADMTVMPLIEGSDYREFVELTSGAKIGPAAGDRHPKALLHYAMAINRKSEPVREFSSFAAGMVPVLQTQPLAWLGESIGIYADESPFWQQLAEHPAGADDYMDEHIGDLPIALHAEVSDGLKLTIFLAALRSFVKTTAPGMTVWENLRHDDQPFVKISQARQATAEPDGSDWAIFYAATPDALIVTPCEAVLRSALDRLLARQKARTDGQATAAHGNPWLGESLCLQVERRLLDTARDLVDRQYREAMQRRSWGNIPILNEWKRLYPDRNLVEVHETVWKTRLVCPGGGAYVWNAEWQTMMSDVYGHPGEPREGPLWPPAALAVSSANLGLTFRDRGLRARAVIDRESKGF